MKEGNIWGKEIIQNNGTGEIFKYMTQEYFPEIKEDK